LKSVKQINKRMRRAGDLLIFYASYLPEGREFTKVVPWEMLRSSLQDPEFVRYVQSVGKKYGARPPKNEDFAFA
jgi:hypothetical protein